MKNTSFNDKLKILSIILIGVIMLSLVIFTLCLFSITINYKYDALFFFSNLIKGVLYGGIFTILSIFLYAFGVILDKLDNK